MMELHLTSDELLHLRERRLPTARVAPAFDHLSSCQECRNRVDVESEAAVVRETFGAEQPMSHLSPEDDLFPYVDGQLAVADRELVETHLEECASCREDVDDLMKLRAPARVRVRAFAVAAAIALPVLSLAVVLYIASRRDQPVPTRPIAPSAQPQRVASYGNPEWNELVSNVLRDHRLPSSPLAVVLRGAGGAVRGDGQKADAALQPFGTVIETTRPTFRWPGSPRSKYVVIVADGDDVIATSNAIRDASWQMDRNLARGHTYTWQVEVISPDGSSFLLPDASAPQAMFHVLSDKGLEEIVTARTKYAADHLLLAALYARNGMQPEALEEIRALGEKHPESVDIQRLVMETRSSLNK